MRCKRCDYRLWNLHSRRCPECGEPFLPSDYEFAPNSVQFCCPDCGQHYFGTGDRGHLVPAEFDCVSCGAHVHMDEMVLLPAAGLDEGQTEVERMPWLDRSQRGRVRALFSTIGMALVRPMKLIRLVPVESRVRSGVWFAVLVNLLVAAVALSPFLLLIAGLTVGGAGGGALAALEVAGVAASLGGVAIVVMLAIVGIWGLACHGLLRLTGPTLAGIGRTYHALCFSAGANVLMGTPCIGPYFGWIWWLISAVLMVKEGQHVHGGRAAFAVLALPLLLIGTLVGLYIWLIVAAVSGSSSATASIAVAAPDETRLVCDSISRYAEDHDGQGPEHAIELVAGGYLDSSDLVDFGIGAEQVPVADTMLDRFDFLSTTQKRNAVRLAVSDLPENLIAHRLGDFVFTYHGLELANPDPALWWVVHSRNPDAKAARSRVTSQVEWLIVVGGGDGSVKEFSASDFPRALARQNELRTARGLPPLPDPSTVTHSNPAVSDGRAPATQGAPRSLRERGD